MDATDVKTETRKPANLHVPHNVKKFVGETRGTAHGRDYLIAVGAYLLITLVMFWYITININGAVPGAGGDPYQSLWELWWTSYAVFTLHASPYFTHLVYFPIGANLATETLMPLASLLTAPLQWISLTFDYNIIFILGYVLSGLFMYMLAYYLTHNKHASFIAGLIFAFSPMHVAQSLGHLNWTSIEFVPLYVLLLLLMIKEKRKRYMVGAAIALLLVIFFGDPEIGIMAALLTVLILVYYIATDKKEILNTGFAARFAGLIVIVALLGLPFFIPIAAGLSQAGNSTSELSSIPNNLLWSNNLVSFFLPSYYNGIFNGLSQSYFNQTYGLTYQGVTYYPAVNEKVSYMGYSVLALVLIALYFDYKKNGFRLNATMLWLLAAIIFGLLSLGPYLQISSDVTGVPGLYLAYRLIPLLNVIREPGRFDMIVTLALGVLAALGFVSLTEGRDKQTIELFAAVFIVAILVEYNASPLSASFAATLASNTTMPIAYPQIGALNGSFTTLILPILPDANSSNPELYPGQAMYYETALKKPIIGGYTSRYNLSQYQSVIYLPLTVSAGYLELGDGLVYPTPVLSNSTNTTLIWLASYNVSFISMTRSAYTYDQQATLYNYLSSFLGQPVYQSNSTIVFETVDAVSKYLTGNGINAYYLGNWLPGYALFCGTGGSCNATLSELWWGDNEREIVVYAPEAKQVTMSFLAIPAVNNLPLGIFLNSETTPTALIQLNYSEYLYTATFNVSRGFNKVIFYSNNVTNSSSPYINYGIKNITFTT